MKWKIVWLYKKTLLNEINHGILIKKIRWAKSHIKNAIPFMFYFLENENIKKSSNDLEWYNWVLDGHIFNHRWLRIDRLISFISLWIYNRNL